MIHENQFDLLQIRNETFIREVAFHHELKSTNTTAMELSQTDAETPLLVLAERQTGGRGRGANTWWSSEGALTFSLLVDLPMLEPEQIGPMSLSIGLAICQTLEKLAPAADLGMKWPNDVFLEDKKVCGILIERPIATEPRLAIGIGINVNNTLADAAAELKANATSLLDTLGTPFELTTVLIEALQNLGLRIDDHVHRRDALLDQWRAYCILTGRELAVDMHGKRIHGRCQGIDKEGALLIVDHQGQTHRCIAGTVLMGESNV